MRQISLFAAFTLLSSSSAFTTSVSHVKATSKTNLSATSRRESFGAMLGSALLPAAAASVGPQAAEAADAYPFKNTLKKLAEVYPESVPNADLINKVSRKLSKYSYDDDTLVAFSLCSDEVNRPLEEVFYGFYGEHFNMGGLAGFPFAGLTGFGAMASHIPDGGSCLLVYGPHVGVDIDGNVGKVNRKGKGKSGGCCGSAVAASRYITAVYEGTAEQIQPSSSDFSDAQQNYVSAALLPYAKRIVTASDPMVELPFATFEEIDKMMVRIVEKAGSKVGGNGNIAMLGGLQINTPRGMSDYFLPLRFDIRSNDGKVIEDLSWMRKPGSEMRRKITA